MEERTITIKEEKLPEFVKELLVMLGESGSSATVLALRGDLGAGKTTFVKALGKELGVTEHITSPTFTIMSRYETNDSTWEQLLHMDAYRIDDISELKPLGFDELLATPKTLFCIEWAEKIEQALPENYIKLNLTNTKKEDERIINISK